MLGGNHLVRTKIRGLMSAGHNIIGMRRVTFDHLRGTGLEGHSGVNIMADQKMNNLNPEDEYIYSVAVLLGMGVKNGQILGM
jgi:hypothetical protein